MKFNSKRNIIEIDETSNIHIPTAILHIHFLILFIMLILGFIEGFGINIIDDKWVEWNMTIFLGHMITHSTNKMTRMYKINPTVAYYYSLRWIILAVSVKIIISL